MSLLQSMKRVVPLEWKVAFHKHKDTPWHLAVRAGNRISGQVPLPPTRLIYLVTGKKSPVWFLDSGRAHSQTIREVLAKHDLKIEQFTSVLDFGCGVGRIMRHLNSTPGPQWYGTDYNPHLVEWCRGHLKFSQFKVNTLTDKLAYADESFDFIYAYSVFTHLNEDLQFFWIDELSRVLKPGGYIYFTTHGEYFVQGMKPDEQDSFQKGQPLIREPQQSGSNFCASFHPPKYVQETLAKNLTVVDFFPGSEHGWSDQDIHLVKKPHDVF